MGEVTNLSQNDTGNMIDATATDSVSIQSNTLRRNPLVAAYVALLLFMVIYYARPEDWIPGLSNVPMVKITGILALLALVFSLRQIRLRLPREVIYLGLLVGQLFLAAVLSPVWRGGAVQTTLDFAKVLIIIIVMAVAVNSMRRLRLLILIQATSVAVVAAHAALKGHLFVGRLEGVLGGNYSNPNDLALAIIISLPLCLVLMFLSESRLRKVAWALAILVMTYVVLLTGSRAGFITLLVIAAVLLFEFAIRGHRRYLLALTALVAVILWRSSSGMLLARLEGTFDTKQNVASAYGSAQQREQLFWRSVEVTKEHPLFGVGPGNFQVISGDWHVTHNSFTQMSSEGGVPALVFYLLILWRGFKNLRKTKQLKRGQGELGLLARALHASLAGFVVGSLFGSVAYQMFPYFLVAYTTAVFSIAKKSVPHSNQQSSVSPARSEMESYVDAAHTKLSYEENFHR
jgi:putative inorganic carbon (HCO3(-)) transporter